MGDASGDAEKAKYLVMIKLLAFADIHLGMTNFGSMDTATGLHSRVLDYLDAVDCVVEAASLYLPDVVLFAGDGFRNRAPNPSLVSHLAERFQRLADIAPVICVVGNHDRQKGGSGRRHATAIFSELHSKYEIVVSDVVQPLYMVESLGIITLPWLYADETDLEKIGFQLDNALQLLPAGLPRVLLGHAEVEGAVYNESYAASFSVGGQGHVYPLNLFTDGAFDLCLLGHVHRHQTLAENILYIGALERVTWTERIEPKGFITAEIDAGKAKWKHHNSYAKPLIQINAIWGEQMADDLRERPVDNSIVRVNVTCEGPVGRDAVISEIYRGLQGEYYLDQVNVINMAELKQREFRGIPNIERKSMMELLEIYFKQQQSDDDQWVQIRLDTARKLIEGESS